MINEQAKHLAYCVAEAQRRGARSFEVTAEAEADWVATILARAQDHTAFAESCTPGYYNNEGQLSPQARQNMFFMGGPLEFVELLDRWRTEGRMEGLALDPPGAS